MSPRINRSRFFKKQTFVSQKIVTLFFFHWKEKVTLLFFRLYFGTPFALFRVYKHSGENTCAHKIPTRTVRRVGVILKARRNRFIPLAKPRVNSDNLNGSFEEERKLDVVVWEAAITKSNKYRQTLTAMSISKVREDGTTLIN